MRAEPCGVYIPKIQREIWIYQAEREPMKVVLIEGYISGKKKEFVDAWQHRVLPLLKKRAHFVDALLLFEHDAPSRGTAVTLWRHSSGNSNWLEKHVDSIFDGRVRMHKFDIHDADRFSVLASKMPPVKAKEEMCADLKVTKKRAVKSLRAKSLVKHGQ